MITNMEKTIRVLRIFWWCAVVAPFGIMTSYNVFRQEVNTNLPPLINLLPNWHWAIWLSIFLFVVVLGLLFELYRKPNAGSQSGDTLTDTSMGTGGVFAPRNKGKIKIVNEVEKKEPPNIYAGVLSRQNHSLIEKVTYRLRPLPLKPDFDELVKKERSRIIQKHHDNKQDLRGGEKTLQYTMNMMSKVLAGRNYPERLESYLLEYRAYEVEVYNFSIIGDRYKMMEMALQCRGISPASLVILEFHFPESIHFPPIEIELLHDEIRRRDGYPGGYKPHRPKEPDPFDTYNPLFESMTVPMNFYETSGQIPPEIKGDYRIEKRGGANVIIYDVQDLIQNHLYTDLVPIHLWLDNFEHSTVIGVPIKIYSKDLKDSPIEKTLEIELIVEENSAGG